MPSSAPPAASDHRARLLEGLARAMALQGYEGTTIADIVREAAVSRRTFYEHFADKSDCMLALFEAAGTRLLEQLRAAVDAGAPWQDQVQQAVATYFTLLSGQAPLLRVLFVAVFAQGVPGMAVRRAALLALVDGLQAIACRSPRAAPLPEAQALALVGGAHELVLQAIERERADDLSHCIAPTVELVCAALLWTGPAHTGD